MMKSLGYCCYYPSSLFSESSFLFLSSFSISQSPRSGEHEVGSGIRVIYGDIFFYEFNVDAPTV
jgi:hypothetical protein